MPARPGARTFDEFLESGWDKVMNLNVETPFFLTKALATQLRAAATEREAGQGEQHRLDRRHLRQSDGDLFLCKASKAGLDPPDAPRMERRS